MWLRDGFMIPRLGLNIMSCSGSRHLDDLEVRITYHLSPRFMCGLTCVRKCFNLEHVMAFRRSLPQSPTYRIASPRNMALWSAHLAELGSKWKAQTENSTCVAVPLAARGICTNDPKPVELGLAFLHQRRGRRCPDSRKETAQLVPGQDGTDGTFYLDAGTPSDPFVCLPSMELCCILLRDVRTLITFCQPMGFPY